MVFPFCLSQDISSLGLSYFLNIFFGSFIAGIEKQLIFCMSILHLQVYLVDDINSRVCVCVCVCVCSLWDFLYLESCYLQIEMVLFLQSQFDLLNNGNMVQRIWST